MISYIHSAAITVADQDASLDFFVNKLGWEKALDVVVGDVMRFLTVVPPGATTQLALLHVDTVGDEIKRGGETGISLVTPDIDATYQTLVERGVEFKQPVSMMSWGQKATWFYDIDGNQFFLTEEGA